AVDWINRDVKLRRTRQPGAELFAFKNPRRIIFDSFTDDHLATDVHEIEHAANGVAGGGIGRFLIAPTKPFQGVERRGFGRAQEIDLDDTLDVVIILLRQARHEEQLLCARIGWLTSRRPSGQRALPGKEIPRSKPQIPQNLSANDQTESRPCDRKRCCECGSAERCTTEKIFAKTLW